MKLEWEAAKVFKQHCTRPSSSRSVLWHHRVYHGGA
ncbi:hypothetical protein HaLaN_30212, partial [Haematococcus lacustris]